MAKFKLPQLTTAQRTGLVLDAREIVFDTDELILYYGDGSTAGGLSLVGPQGPQGPPGTLTAVVDDPSPQLGGFLDPNGNYIGFDKGSDIASASPLVIGIDGDYFDVTGSTGFSTMTVVANRFFILRFTGILTVTNGSPITIPGVPSNFTTTIGDQFLCFSTATNTVKVIAVTKIDGTAVATNLLADLTPQLGGFLDPNGKYIGSGKGGNIASSSPLVIGIDGDYFNITGTTGFSGITVAANRNFTLQFDGILTIVVGSGITLNNAGGNFTTAPGDVIEFQSTAVNTVVGTISKADGTSPVGGVGGGAWTLINTITANDDSSLIITGLDSTYDTYAIGLSDLDPAVNNSAAWMRVGDSGGIDTGTSDYQYHTGESLSSSSSYSAINSNADTKIVLGTLVGGGTSETFGAMIFLHRPGDGLGFPIFSGTVINGARSSNAAGGSIVANRVSVIVLDRIEFLFDTGNVTSGRMSIWGINHV